VPEIVSSLLDAGLAGDMPAAVIQQGTLPHLQQVVTHIANLPLAVKQHRVMSPALIVVGKVASLARIEQFAMAQRIAA